MGSLLGPLKGLSSVFVIHRWQEKLWHLFFDATCYVGLGGDSENILKLSASLRVKFTLSLSKFQSSRRIWDFKLEFYSICEISVWTVT